MNPSASHGVGTVVMGNCGVGFAPVAPNGVGDLIELMEGVEDIPGAALHEGMPWGSWETYPEYLDFLATRQYAIDVSSMIAHGPVRNYVMGQRGRENQAASADDLTAMTKVVHEALQAGAVGFSTSRILGHMAVGGEPVPGTFASDAEILSLAQALKAAGRGVFQLIPAGGAGPEFLGKAERRTVLQEMDLFSGVSRESGRPVTFSLISVPGTDCREVVAKCKLANEAGAEIYPQVGCRPLGFVMSIETYHPWMLRPSYRKISELPIADQLAQMRDASFKATVMAEEDVTDGVRAGTMEWTITKLRIPYSHWFTLDRQSTYEPTEQESFAGRAGSSESATPESLLYDYLVEAADRRVISMTTNFDNYSLDALYELQKDPGTLTGLSDAGAHVTIIFDAVAPTYQLSYWTRDRTRGERLPLSGVIHKSTRRNAQLFGFTDRGLIKPGFKADVNVIDYENLKLGDLSLAYDLPAGGARLLQGAQGYLACLINGETTRRFDADTGARPGRLVRSRGA
jgi:N-acyl-D-aspartate/D-glutamate deacylase